MESVRYPAGSTILAKGDEGNTAFLVVSGAVEVIVGGPGKERTLARLGPGDVFGEMSLLAPGPRSATVRATTDTECTVTSYDEFLESIRDNPEQAIEFMKTLVMRLRKMNELIASLDPKRGLIGLFWDYVSSADLDDELVSEEERERRRAVATMPVLW